MNDQNLEMVIPEFLKSENIGKLSDRERYENVVRNSTNRNNKRKKDQARKRAISTTFIASNSYVMALLSVFGIEQSKGKDIIIANFNNKYVSGTGLNRDNLNDKVDFGGVKISSDNLVDDLVKDALSDGWSKGAVFVALIDLGGKGFADKHFEVSLGERIEAKDKAFHEWKVSQYDIKDSRGISR